MALVRAATAAAFALALACSGAGPSPPPATCAVAGVPGTCVETSVCAGFSASTVGPCAGTLVCCTPAVAASGCDPAVYPLPNAGLAEDPGTGGCPSGMVAVDGFCVDRYEAALVRVDTGAPWSPYQNPGSVPVRAVSFAVAVPQAHVSQPEAASACAAAGKRLCTDAEWLRACRGPGQRVYPYGDVHQVGACNDERAVHPAAELFGTSDPWIWSFLDHPCLNQLAGSLARTGERMACETSEGARDMAGNLNEWTSDVAGTMRGGSYVTGALNGPGCLSATTAHSGAHHDHASGFRCCADP